MNCTRESMRIIGLGVPETAQQKLELSCNRTQTTGINADQ